MADQKSDNTKPADSDKSDDKKPAPKPPAGDDKQQDGKPADAKYIADLRAENQRYRQSAKENADKAQKYDDQIEADKSDLQKAIDRAEAAEKSASLSDQKRLRSEIARAKGLPASMGARLSGATKEDMEADADVILADLDQGYVSKKGGSQSATGAGVAGQTPSYEEMSPADLIKLAHR